MLTRVRTQAVTTEVLMVAYAADIGGWVNERYGAKGGRTNIYTTLATNINTETVVLQAQATRTRSPCLRPATWPQPPEALYGENLDSKTSGHISTAICSGKGRCLRHQRAHAIADHLRNYMIKMSRTTFD